MPKKPRRPSAAPAPAPLDAGLVLEEVRRQYATLLEAHRATRSSIEIKFDERFERFDQRLDRLETRTGALDHWARVAGSDIKDLKAGQARLEDGQTRIETQLADVVHAVKRHDAEIIKLWAVRRPGHRRSGAR
jgi:hypothetical protein